MSLPAFTLSIDGSSPALCSDLGWALETITRRNLAPDSATLRHLHSGAETIEYGSTIVLFADGKRIYTGTAQPPRISLGGNVTVQVLGPWWHLDQTPFTRGLPRLVGTGATATAARTGAAVSSVSVTAPGSGYIAATATFVGGGGSGAKAVVTISSTGTVSAITVVAGGSGYSSNPTVVITGSTQLPPMIGELYTIPDPDGAGPLTATTYEWAREANPSATPYAEIDIAQYTGTRGLMHDPNWYDNPIYRTTQKEVSEVLYYFTMSRARLALGDRPDLTPAFSVDLDAIETGLGASASPKYRMWQDTKCGPLLVSLLATKPDVAAWFDYDSEAPVLNMRVASLETEQTLVYGQAPLMSLDATPRPDLRPEGVLIRWEYATDNDWDWRGYRVPAHTDKSPATILAHEPGILTHTIDFSDDISSFKPTLAASLMDSLGTLRASGSMTLGGMTLDEALAIRPGLCYRLDVPMLAEAQLRIQETTWNATTNQVQCTLGYPRALDLQTLGDLQGWLTWTIQGIGIASRTQLLPPPP